MTGAPHDPDWDVLLHGFADNELDAANALRFEQHIASCPTCADELAELVAMRRRFQRPGIAQAAPDALRRRVLASIEAERHRRGGSWLTQIATRLRGTFGSGGLFSLVPSLAVLAAALMLVVGRPAEGPAVEDDIVAGHVRSLLASHLTDVATSNQHVVKPWFNGRIDFSPPVVDLVNRGYPLVGGRVDYIGGRVVAALVYRRNGHVINLFVWPSAAGPAAGDQRDGYNILRWTAGGLAYWAVSDLNAEELEAFRAEFRRETGT